jgi:hypothetical protein
VCRRFFVVVFFFYPPVPAPQTVGSSFMFCFCFFFQSLLHYTLPSFRHFDMREKKNFNHMRAKERNTTMLQQYDWKFKTKQKKKK